MPKKPQPRACHLMIRLTKPERRVVERRAEAHNLTLSQYARTLFERDAGVDWPERRLVKSK